MRKILAGLAALLIGLAALGGVHDTTTARADAASVTLRAGDGKPGYAVEAFLPGTATVKTGTKVTWKFAWYEPHNVAFGVSRTSTDPVTPKASGGSYDGTGAYASEELVFGSPDKPATFDITFTKAGSYSYICTIHPFMEGKIVVVNSGVVDSQNDLDARGTNDYVNRLANLQAVAGQINARPVVVTPQAAGGSKHELVVGAGTQAGDDVMQMLPQRYTVKAGDTVQWTDLFPSPHTVTFGALNPPPGPGFDPFAVPPSSPAGGYDGTGFVNSGILQGSVPGAPADPHAVASFSLKFTKPGTYDYYCILHADQGMVGQIVVEAAPPPPTRAPGPPNTGTGNEAGGGLGWFLVAGITLAVLAGGGAVAMTRRQGR